MRVVVSSEHLDNDCISVALDHAVVFADTKREAVAGVAICSDGEDLVPGRARRRALLYLGTNRLDKLFDTGVEPSAEEHQAASDDGDGGLGSSEGFHDL